MNIEIKTIVGNLKTIVSEFPVKAKDYDVVIVPISIFLHNLETGKWRVVEDVPVTDPYIPKEPV